MIGPVYVVLACLALGIGGCRGTQETTLTHEQLRKLDPALRHLVLGDTAAAASFRYSTSRRSDGAMAYALIVHASDVDVLREAGLPLNTVLGEVITVHWTVEEIRQAVRFPEVASIRNSPPINRPLKRRRR